MWGMIVGAVAGLFKNFFGWKEAQAQTVQKALEGIQAIDDNDAKSVAALAQSLQVILSQGSWLERNWRSWLMTGLMIILFASFFGYVPPHFNDPMSPTMERYLNLLEIGLGGYIVRRGIVDVVRIFNIGSVLKTLINKRLT